MTRPAHTTTAGTPAAPAAPGALGRAPSSEQLLAYLEALMGWRADRKSELEQLDAAALRSPNGDACIGDLTLALSMWQAVSDRYDELVRIWDSGRVGFAERERMSRVIWGRLDGSAAAAPSGSGGIGVSLVEAARLCDAVTAALRARLAFDPETAQVAARIAAVRAGLQRCTELDRNPADRLARLLRRLDQLASRAAEGADVSGPLSGIEVEAARIERDLIVDAGRRGDLALDRQEAQARRAELEDRETALRRLAARCVREIARPPRLAVPDVAALGPVPNSRAELDAWRARLERVAAALQFAEDAYGTPLRERDELQGRLMAFGAKLGATAARRAAAVQAALVAAFDEARLSLAAVPCDLDAARTRVTGFEQQLRSA